MVPVTQLIDRGIITKAVTSDYTYFLHLEIKGISLISGVGVIGEKITLPPKTLIQAKTSSVMSERGWFLEQGVYEVELYQGCDAPSGVSLTIIPNGDIVKCGGLISQLPSELPMLGYKVENMRLILQVTNSIFIKSKGLIGKLYATDIND